VPRVNEAVSSLRPVRSSLNQGLRRLKAKRNESKTRWKTLPWRKNSQDKKRIKASNSRTPFKMLYKSQGWLCSLFVPSHSEFPHHGWSDLVQAAVTHAA
jgi:hypothetical protein